MTDDRLVDMIIKHIDTLDSKIDKVQEDVSYLKATSSVANKLENKKVLAGSAGVSTVMTGILVGAWHFLKDKLS